MTLIVVFVEWRNWRSKCFLKCFRFSSFFCFCDFFFSFLQFFPNFIFNLKKVPTHPLLIYIFVYFILLETGLIFFETFFLSNLNCGKGDFDWWAKNHLCFELWFNSMFFSLCSYLGNSLSFFVFLFFIYIRTMMSMKIFSFYFFFSFFFFFFFFRYLSYSFFSNQLLV